MTGEGTPRPPADAVDAAGWAIATGINHNHTPAHIALSALIDAYPAIERHVVEGLLEDLEDEIRVRSYAMADAMDRDEAYALGEQIDELSGVRHWLQRKSRVVDA